MISVVVPAYNEEKLVKKFLDSLVNQSTNQSFEVIFVDNNSTDNTKKIALSYNTRLNIHIYFEKHKGRGAARKLGFSKSVGDIILSTDTDAILPTNWVEQLTKRFTDTTIVAVTGTCRIKDCSFVTNILFNTFYQTATELFYRLIEGHWCLIGPNFAIRKDIYDKTNGFDASLNCREDADLSAKIAKIGNIQRITLAVTFSGRRYKHGLFFGMFPYIFNRCKQAISGKSTIILSDIR